MLAYIFYILEMFGNLIIEKLSQLDLTLNRHPTKFFKNSDVSKIGFPTPVLQFGNTGPKTILKKENMCFPSFNLQIELVQLVKNVG